MAYSTDQKLRAKCNLSHRSPVFYHFQLEPKIRDNLPKRLAIFQAYPNYLIAQRNTAFRIFAELSVRDCYILAKLPYKEPSGKGIWTEDKFPALRSNSNVKRVICVDGEDNSKTKMLFSRPEEDAIDE